MLKFSLEYDYCKESHYPPFRVLTPRGIGRLKKTETTYLQEGLLWENTERDKIVSFGWL